MYKTPKCVVKKTWYYNASGTTTLKQQINLQSGLALTLHSCLLPPANEPVLFCALDDHKVHIFVQQDDSQYHRVHMLAGHEDWVRGLDVLNVGKENTFNLVKQELCLKIG